MKKAIILTLPFLLAAAPFNQFGGSGSFPTPGAPSGTLEAIVAAMPTGSWAQIPMENTFWSPGVAITPTEETAIRTAYSAPIIGNGNNFYGNGGPQQVFGSWNSSAYDPAGNRMFFLGGGLNNYGGNEVYELDFDTLLWRRINDPIPYTEPTVNGPDTCDPGDANDASYEADHGVDSIPDAPAVAHSYDGVEWNPTTGTLWYSSTGGTSFPNSVEPAYRAIWEIDPDEGTWIAHPRAHNEKFSMSEYVQATGQILSLDAVGCQSVSLTDPDGTTYDLGLPLGNRQYQGSIFGMMFRNTETGQIYIASKDGMGIWSVAIDGTTSMTSTFIVALPDDILWQNFYIDNETGFSGAGVAWHPDEDKFYFWNGLEKTATWDPATNEFDLLWNENSTSWPEGPTVEGNTFNKFHYLPDLGVFVGIMGPDGEAVYAPAGPISPGTTGGPWLYKPGSNPADINSTLLGVFAVDGRTTTSISVTAPLGIGDENLDGGAYIEYRETGSGTWIRSVDLMRVLPQYIRADYNFTKQPSSYSGMILGLDPDTEYEIRLTATDPDGFRSASEPGVQTVTVSTREIPVTNPASPNVVNVSNVSELTSAVAAASPGDVITLAAGTYTLASTLFITADGTEANPIVLRGANRATTIIDGDGTTGRILAPQGNYIHIENLTIQNGAKGIAAWSGTTEERIYGLTIRDCYLTGITDIGMELRQYGGVEDLYVANNVLEGPQAALDTVTGGSVEGIVVAGRDFEITNNTLSGFFDTLGMSSQVDWNIYSGVLRNNLVLWAADDAIEFDFSTRNVAAHNNLLTNTANGLSFQPVYGGPVYAIENIIYNAERGPLKLKIEFEQPSGIYVVNNTFIKNGTAQKNTSGIAANVTVVNNLWVGDGTLENGEVLSDTVNYLDGVSVWDYNAWSQDGAFHLVSQYGVNFAAFQADGSNEQNSLLLTGETIFATLTLDFDDTAGGYLFGELYRDPAGKAFGLHASSSARDAGLQVPGITPAGDVAPDIGAVQYGVAEPSYGADWTP